MERALCRSGVPHTLLVFPGEGQPGEESLARQHQAARRAEVAGEVRRRPSRVVQGQGLRRGATRGHISAEAESCFQVLAIPSAQTNSGAVARRDFRTRHLPLLRALARARGSRYSNDESGKTPSDPTPHQALPCCAATDASRSHMQARVIVRRLDPINLGGLQEGNVSRALHHKPLQRRRRKGLRFSAMRILSLARPSARSNRALSNGFKR